MRCPDCQKFVSYDDPPEVEVSGEHVTDDNFTAEVHVFLLCAECSTKLKSADLIIEESIERQCDCENDDDEPGEIEVSIDAEGTSRQHMTAISVIRNLHDAKTFYGAELSASFSCSKCRAEWTETYTVEEQASAFDEAY